MQGGKLSVLAAAVDPRVVALCLLDPVDNTVWAPLGPGYPSAIQALKLLGSKQVLLKPLTKPYTRFVAAHVCDVAWVTVFNAGSQGKDFPNLPGNKTDYFVWQHGKASNLLRGCVILAMFPAYCLCVFRRLRARQVYHLPWWGLVWAVTVRLRLPTSGKILSQAVHPLPFPARLRVHTCLACPTTKADWRTCISSKLEPWTL